MFGKIKVFFICNYHGKFLPVAGRNATNSILSKIRLITHKHDGNVLVGHILPRKKKPLETSCVLYISMKVTEGVVNLCFTLSTNFCTVHYMRKPLIEYTKNTHTHRTPNHTECMLIQHLHIGCM